MSDEITKELVGARKVLTTNQFAALEFPTVDRAQHRLSILWRCGLVWRWRPTLAWGGSAPHHYALGLPACQRCDDKSRQFIEDLGKAGVYVAAEGLDDPGQGVVVDFSGQAPVVTDGPYGETKALWSRTRQLSMNDANKFLRSTTRVPT